MDSIIISFESTKVHLSLYTCTHVLIKFVSIVTSYIDDSTTKDVTSLTTCTHVIQHVHVYIITTCINIHPNRFIRTIITSFESTKAHLSLYTCTHVLIKFVSIVTSYIDDSTTKEIQYQYKLITLNCLNKISIHYKRNTIWYKVIQIHS